MEAGEGRLLKILVDGSGKSRQVFWNVFSFSPVFSFNYATLIASFILRFQPISFRPIELIKREAWRLRHYTKL